MTGPRWIVLDDATGLPYAAAAGPLPTGRAIRILKETRRRATSKLGKVRLIPVDVAIQPIDVDQAIADLDARPVGS